MRKMSIDQMGKANGGNTQHLACGATAGLFGVCVGFIVGAFSMGVGTFVGWVVGVGLAYVVC